MKVVTTMIAIISLAGCSSSTDDTQPANNALLGKWLSNCHEFLNTEDESGNNRYVIDTATFTESEYINEFVSYTDSNCTENPIEESSTSTYTIGDTIATTDGLDAKRITFTPIIQGNQNNLSFDFVFTISGTNLNLGMYTEGEIPSIDFSITYTRL